MKVNRLTSTLLLVLASFLFIRPAMAAPAAMPDKQKLLNELAAMPFFDKEVQFMIKQVSDSLISRDRRIPLADKSKLMAALEGSIPKANVSDELKLLYSQVFSAEELDYMLKLRQSAYAAKVDSSLPYISEQMMAFTRGLVQTHFEGATHLTYPTDEELRPNTPIRASEPHPGWFTRMIWSLFPSTKSCSSN